MRGHEALIAMRKGGFIPDMVFIDTEADRLRQWEDWQAETPAQAALYIEPRDSLLSIDLRCVVALTVSVSGSDAKRVAAVAAACEQARAERVIAHVMAPGKHGDLCCVAITDTKGVMTWQAS
jgi:hypothetical protein